MSRCTDVRITHRCPPVTAVIMLSNATILILKLLYQLPLIVCFVSFHQDVFPLVWVEWACLEDNVRQGHAGHRWWVGSQFTPISVAMMMSTTAILMYRHSISLPCSLCHLVATGTKPYNNPIFIDVTFKQCAKHTTFHNPSGYNDQPRPVSRSGVWGPIHPCLCLNLKIKLKM